MALSVGNIYGYFQREAPNIRGGSKGCSVARSAGEFGIPHGSPGKPPGTAFFLDLGHCNSISAAPFLFSVCLLLAKECSGASLRVTVDFLAACSAHMNEMNESSKPQNPRR